MRTTFNRRFTITFFIWGLFASSDLLAQDLNGTVADRQGEHIPFVHVWFKGTSTGTYANRDGSFHLSTIASDTVVFSVIGYVRKELPVNRARELSKITMEEAILELEAVELNADELDQKKELGFKKAGGKWANMVSAIREDYSQKLRIDVGQFPKEGFIDGLSFRVIETSSSNLLVGELFFVTYGSERNITDKPIYFTVTPEQNSVTRIDLLSHEIPYQKGQQLEVYITFLGYEEEEKLVEGSLTLAMASKKTSNQRTFM